MKAGSVVSIFSFMKRHTGWLLAGTLLLLSVLYMEQTLLASGGDMLLGHDTRSLWYPWHTVAHDAVLSGRLPFWDVTQGSGYPFLHNPQLAFFYPPMFIAILLPARIGLSLFVSFHLWLGAVGMMLFIRYLNRGRRAGWLGPLLAGLAFGFSGFATARISAGHFGLLATHNWVPWMLLATAWAIDRADLPSAVIAGIPFSMSIFGGHTPSLFYVVLLWGVFVMYLVFTTPRRMLVLRQVIIAGFISLLLSAIALVPAGQLIMNSLRGAGLIGNVGDWSLPAGHFATLVIPDFYGDVMRGTFDARSFEEYMYYAGVLPVLWLALSLRRPDRRTLMFLALIVFGALVAIGNNGFLYQLIYDIFPPFRLVRVPARALFLYTFSISALLGDSVAGWEEAREQDNHLPLKNLLKTATLIFAVLGIIGLTVGGAVIALGQRVPGPFSVEYFVSGWLLFIIYLLAGAYLSYLFFFTGDEQANRRVVAGALLALLVVVDLWNFGFKMMSTWPAKPAAYWLDAQNIIGESEQRVLPLSFSPIWIGSDATLLGMRSTGGDIPLQLEAYNEFVMHRDDPRSAAYDVLGVAFVLASGELDAGYMQGDDGLVLAGNTGNVTVYGRPHALPVVRLAYAYERIENPQAANNRLHEADFDPKTTVILEREPACAVGLRHDDGSIVQVMAQRPGLWEIQTQSETPALLVIGETDYPGWQVTVDGEPAEPHTAYTAVKAVCVPAGEHTVIWKFTPRIFIVGAVLTLAALIAVVLSAITINKTNLSALIHTETAEETAIND